jgi:hypothetical protein
MCRSVVLMLMLVAVATLAARPTDAVADQSWFPQAPSLPPPKDRNVNVEDENQLQHALRQAQPGDTILVADGHYRISSLLRITTDDLTLRSASGEPDAVSLDGAALTYGELIGLFDCTGITIADLTLQNVRLNALKINADQGNGVHRLMVHNCRFRNIWQRAIESVQIRQPEQAPSDVTVQYCRFRNDRAKTFSDDPADQPGQSFDGNYVGGIDCMYARRWTVSDNVFEGIRGRTGSGRAAIFLWVDSRDSLIQRNLIIDCDRGIELGNASKPDHIDVHCTGITVRENQITRAPIGAVTLTHTRDCRVELNSIFDPENRFRRSIRVVSGNTNLVVSENLIVGAPPQIEAGDQAEITLKHHQEEMPPSIFRNPDAGDLRRSDDGF